MLLNPGANTPRMNLDTFSESGPSDYKTLQRLRQACRLTLERYVDEASLHSGHLARLTPGTLTDLGRSNLRILEQREQRAHDAYRKAAAALLSFVLETQQ